MKNIKHLTKDGFLIYRIAKKCGEVESHSASWYLVRWVGSRAVYFSLGRVLKDAAKLAGEIDGLIRSGTKTVDEVKEQFSMNRRKGPEEAPCVSTIAEVVYVLRNEYALLNLNRDTAWSYASSILKIVREAAAENDRKVDPSAEPCAVLTSDTLNKFKTRRSRLAASTNDELKKVSALRSANKDLRQARAAFSEEALKLYAARNIQLPEMKPWVEVTKFRNVKVKYRLPKKDLIIPVMKKIRTLEAGSDLWLAVHLAAFYGLRSEEIIYARWDWFTMDSVPIVEIKRESDFVPKKAHERKIEIQPWVFAALKATQKAGSVHVLSGDQAQRRKTVNRITIDYLRVLGIDVQKPLHEFRKWFGSFCTAQRGLTYAQRQLGHESYATTEAYYGDVHFPEVLSPWWESGEVSDDGPIAS